MEVKFIKTSPTQNMTLLIETPIAEEMQLELAEKLMAYNSVYAEQVGFIHEPIREGSKKGLRMMAGEFCGNAALSLAAWLVEREGLQEGEEREIFLDISGAPTAVLCQMKRQGSGFFGRVSIPLPKTWKEEGFRLAGRAYQFPVIRFAGIAHIIVPREVWGEQAKALAEQGAREWTEKMPEAFGILLWEEKTGFLEPLVTVQGVGSIWEKGCGSGTSAIGVYLAMKKGQSISLECHQPGGTMTVEAWMEQGAVAQLKIGGNVRIVATGTAYL